LRRHGWGEQRIKDVFKNAVLNDPEHWRCYRREQRQRELVGGRFTLTTVNCLEDKATFDVIGTEPGGQMQWSVHVEEVVLLLPADADGTPLSPQDAQAALALPMDVSNAPAPAAPNRLLDPKELFDELREANPQEQRERPGDYARRLHGLMEDQRDRLRFMWDSDTIRRALYRKP
jgi:hypothetical protein